MNSLGPPDSHYLRAAEGWLELGHPDEACRELEKISAHFQAHSDVLEIQWQVAARAKKWEACAQLGKSLIKLEPGRVSGWIYRAYGLRRAMGGGLQAAWDALFPAVERFPDVDVVPFNLACYAAQLGRIPEARDWLHRASEIAKKAGHLKHLRLKALAEPDLEPLWR